MIEVCLACITVLYLTTCYKSPKVLIALSIAWKLKVKNKKSSTDYAKEIPVPFWFLFDAITQKYK